MILSCIPQTPCSNLWGAQGAGAALRGTFRSPQNRALRSRRAGGTQSLSEDTSLDTPRPDGRLC